MDSADYPMADLITGTPNELVVKTVAIAVGPRVAVFLSGRSGLIYESCPVVLVC
jgi:hypothetical protein